MGNIRGGDVLYAVKRRSEVDSPKTKRLEFTVDLTNIAVQLGKQFKYEPAAWKVYTI